MSLNRKFLSLLAVACLLPLTGCQTVTDSSAQASDKGYSGTYEEWLASVKGEKGDAGAKGESGDAGKSVVSVVKTSTSGNVDTYTVTFDDGTTTTFEITNGVDGKSEKDQLDPNATFGLKYHLQDDDTYYVSGGNTEYLDSVSVPATHNGKAVTGLEDHAFREFKNLKTISLSDGLDVIGKEAFRASGLTTIDLPDSVTCIEENAFEECRSLTHVSMPENLTSVGFYPFQGCDSLEYSAVENGVCYLGSDTNDYLCLYDARETTATELILPETLRVIAQEAFFECETLTSVTLQDQVVNIGETAFWKCTSLTSIDLGNSVQTIERNAFQETGITSVVMPDSLTDIGYAAFIECKDLESVTFSKNITAIKDATFQHCEKLVSITVPDKVTKIGREAFDSCTLLSSFTFGTNVTSLGNGVFGDCPALTALTYNGTMAEFDAITKKDNWNEGSSLTTVHCTDGDITLTPAEEE